MPALSWLLNLGFAGTAADTPAPAPETGQTPAGKRKRRKYVVEIDGQEFSVDTVADAQALLAQAKALAPQQAEQQVRREVKRARRRGRKLTELTLKLPEIETQSIALEPLIAETQAEIRRIYERVAMEAEIRELMRVKLIEEDEEDAIVALLLH